MNGEWFEAYVKHVLGPKVHPGDVAIMDNLSAHKRTSIRPLINARGARLYCLPPSSPDLTSCPQLAFAKLKAHLRKAAYPFNEQTSPKPLEITEIKQKKGLGGFM